MADILGFVFQCLFLALGLYLYWFAIGKITRPAGERGQKMEAFRQRNHRWMRLLGLALAAVALVNVLVYLLEWLR